tara:strand:+ start:707 stop:1414 length:708 start_codon:yes stop_codon:yes gene_type:complete
LKLKDYPCEGGQCPGTGTCCNDGSDTPCCPDQDAVCCGGGTCCPSGTTCDAGYCQQVNGGLKVLQTKGLASANRTNATKTKTLDGICSVIADDLPSECQCTSGSGVGEFTVACTVDFLDIDEIGLTGNFQPCGSPAQANFEVTEADLGIDYTKSYEAGDAQEFPIPGLTVGIPIVGDAQVELAVNLGGDFSSLTVALGLDACIDTVIGDECGSDVSSELPYYAIQDSYDFSNYCN